MHEHGHTYLCMHAYQEGQGCTHTHIHRYTNSPQGKKGELCTCTYTVLQAVARMCTSPPSRLGGGGREIAQAHVQTHLPVGKGKDTAHVHMHTHVHKNPEEGQGAMHKGRTAHVHRGIYTPMEGHTHMCAHTYMFTPPMEDRIIVCTSPIEGCTHVCIHIHMYTPTIEDHTHVCTHIHVQPS